jgi:hypothetical protein
MTDKIHVAVTVQTCSGEACGSNLEQDISYPA